MKRKSGRAKILRRIEELETRWTDGSGLVPHSPEWLEFWQRELDKSAAGQKYVRLTAEAARAILQAIPDEDAGDEGGVGEQNNCHENNNQAPAPA